MSLGKRVREAREKKGLSQADLGRLAGLGQQTIASIESGDTKNPRRLNRIADVLSVPEAYLKYGILPDMSQAELDMLTKLRDAPNHVREELLKYLEFLVSKH